MKSLGTEVPGLLLAGELCCLLRRFLGMGEGLCLTEEC